MTQAQKKKLHEEFREEGIVVNGCLIKDNTVYTVVSKSPRSAPDVYRRQLDSEKEKLPFVSNVKCFGNVNGLVDNGFHPNSDVFNRMRIKDYQERQEKAEQFVEIFLEPLRSMISYDDFERFTDPRAYDIFEGEKYPDLAFCDVREQRQFNTANPIDRYHMYLAVISDGLVEKGSRSSDELEKGQSDEIISNAQYAYESKDKVKSFREKSAINNVKASANFGKLLAEDRETLINLLNFNFSKHNNLVNIKDSDETLYIVFDTAILKHPDHRARTRKIVAEFEEYENDKKKYKAVFEVYNAILKNDKEFYDEKGSLVINGQEYANPKLAAQNIAENPKSYKEFFKALNGG